MEDGRRTIPFSAAQAEETPGQHMRVSKRQKKKHMFTPSSRTMIVVLGTLANSFLTRSQNICRHMSYEHTTNRAEIVHTVGVSIFAGSSINYVKPGYP